MKMLKITDDSTRSYPHYSIRQAERSENWAGWVWRPIAWAKSLADAVDITRNLGATLHPDSLTLDDEVSP